MALLWLLTSTAVLVGGSAALRAVAAVRRDVRATTAGLHLLRDGLHDGAVQLRRHRSHLETRMAALDAAVSQFRR